MYGVPGGNDEAGKTEWKIEVILPVVVDITMVAAVNLSSITAREEARTVISEALASIFGLPLTGCGVSVPVAKGAMVSII